MKKKKLSKQQVWEKQNIEEKKFNRNLILSFSLLIFIALLIITLVTFKCETQFFCRKWVWYGKEIPSEWTCMNGNNLQLHKTSKVGYENNDYYFCSQNCFNHLVKHFGKVAIVPDVISGDSINKVDAVIGLKERGKPELIYFKNEKTFKKYYEQKIN